MSVVAVMLMQLHSYADCTELIIICNFQGHIGHSPLKGYSRFFVIIGKAEPTACRPWPPSARSVELQGTMVT